MLARHFVSSPTMVGGLGDFSWNSTILPWPSASITPKSTASCLGTGMAATVTPASVSMWWSTI
jgi:hypothetical protein